MAVPGGARSLTVAVTPAQQQSRGVAWDEICAAGLLRVYYLLDSREVAACSCVCRKWRDVGQTKRLWRVLLVREVGCPLKRYDTSGIEENYRQMLVDAKTARLWSWGANVLKLTGISADSITMPTEVFLHAIEVGPSVSGIAFSAESHAELRNLPAREVSCAEDFAVILTWEGQVIDSRGSLANNAPWRHQGRSLAPLAEWRFAQECNQVVSVAAGGTWSGHNVSGGHAAAVTADGRLWVWGGNGSGQLGLGEDAEAWISAPRRVDCPGGEGSSDWPAPISAVACGAAHTAVILADGSLWVTGSNHLGCCGLPESIEEVHCFTRVDLHKHRCAQLAAGGHNTVLLTAAGRVLVCGSNLSGQCGMPPAIACSHGFLDVGPNAGWHGMSTDPRVPCQIVRIACGGDSLYVLDSSGGAFAWGAGGAGELGIGALVPAAATPSRMVLANAMELVVGSAGGKFGAAVDQHGRLFTFGNGRAGQLGQGGAGQRSLGRLVKTLQPVVVRRAAAGAAFCMAISSWRCPAANTPPETPEPSSTPGFLSPVASSREGDDFEASSSSHFYTTSLRGTLGASASLHRNSSAASWASDFSDGLSLYTSSAGEMEDEEDDEDFMADDVLPSETDSIRKELGVRCSSFPGSVNRLAAMGQCRSFMAGPGSSLQNLAGASGVASGAASGATSEADEAAPSSSGGGRDFRRQLRLFMQDWARRELVFPPTLSATERHEVHVLADAWGLCHQSRGQGVERQLRVWKPSKAIRRAPSALGTPVEIPPPLLERDEDAAAENT